MKQYSFEMVNKKSGTPEQAHCTAANADIARSQLVIYYSSYEVGQLPCNVSVAHKIYGEIDATSFPKSDTAWLKRMMAEVELKAQLDAMVI